MEFVTFEIAKKLKEKGFKEKTYKHYYPDSNDWFISSSPECDNYSGYLDVPTISQALKWLREEKRMFVIVEIADSGWYHTIEPNIRWENGKLKSDKYIMSFKHKESYEQAALAGIEYVLDNLI